MKYGVEVASAKAAMRSARRGGGRQLRVLDWVGHRGQGKEGCLPPRYGFTSDMMPDPIASPARSTCVKGTWPG